MADTANVVNITAKLSLILASVVTAALATSYSMAQEPAAGPTSSVVLMSDVNWEQLNPARGDKSPQAGTLWGERKGSVPTGFLVRFMDGFSSPPHIHNVSYRGVVIHGLVHNDDPDAADLWMGTGSFWTQPKGEIHITAARGSTNVAYIEIEQGPYLVLSTEKVFDSGERPVNVDAANIVWLDTSIITGVNQPAMSASPNGPGVAFLWGNPQQDQLYGSLVRLPAGFTGKIDSQGSTFRAVVIKGQPLYQVPGETDVKTLEPGSYFSSKGESVHQVSSEAGEESIIYVRTDGRYEVIATK